MSETGCPLPAGGRGSRPTGVATSPSAGRSGAQPVRRERGRFGAWMRRGTTRTGYAWGALVVLAATGGAMAWTYATTHQIFPDTQYYLAWAFRLMGYDRASAERMVFDYIDQHGVFPHYEDLWAFRTGRLSTRPRVLLWALSVPFIRLFGPGGIVVVPGIAFVAAMYLMYRFAAVHARVPAAAAACVVTVSSSLVLKWSVGGLTDSIALALHAGMFVLLPWRRAATPYSVAGVGAVCALTAFARVISPYSAAAMAGLWLWAMLRAPGRRWSWTAVTAAAAVGVLAGVAWTRVASQLTSRDQVSAMTGGRYSSYRQALPWYQEVAMARLGTEIHRVVADRILLLLIVLSFVACVTAWRTVVPFLVLPAWVGAAGVFLINPAVTEFRYELPVLPALVVAVAVLAGQAAALARLAGRRIPGRTRLAALAASGRRHQIPHAPPGGGGDRTSASV